MSSCGRCRNATPKRWRICVRGHDIPNTWKLCHPLCRWCIDLNVTNWFRYKFKIRRLLDFCSRNFCSTIPISPSNFHLPGDKSNARVHGNCCSCAVKVTALRWMDAWPFGLEVEVWGEPNWANYDVLVLKTKWSGSYMIYPPTISNNQSMCIYICAYVDVCLEMLFHVVTANTTCL